MKWLWTNLAGAFVIAMGLPGLASQPQTDVWPNAPTTIQEFVRSAIADRMKANDVPDLDLRFGRNRDVSIRREMTSARLLLTNQAVPQVDGFSFTLRTRADLQAEADRTQKVSPMFIIVNDAAITDDRGVITLGTDILLPAGRPKLCCCWGTAAFTRSSDSWTFVSWNNSIVCS